MAISTSHLFVLLSIVTIFAPFSLAVDHIVGDDAGWTTNKNYSEWTQGKMFNVGDNLIFNYPAGEHNVLKVNGSEFQNCTIPAGQNALTTGHDIIKLATSGKKWYICGKEGHCGLSQKLVITVMDMAPAPSAATKPVVSAQFGFAAAVVAILGMIMA